MTWPLCAQDNGQLVGERGLAGCGRSVDGNPRRVCDCDGPDCLSQAAEHLVAGASVHVLPVLVSRKVAVSSRPYAASLRARHCQGERDRRSPLWKVDPGAYPRRTDRPPGTLVGQWVPGGDGVWGNHRQVRTMLMLTPASTTTARPALATTGSRKAAGTRAASATTPAGWGQATRLNAA